MDDKEVIDEEAVAEEEFVSDLEDTIENPLVYDGDRLTVQNKVMQEDGGEKEELAGAIGSGELVVNKPFNNEEALRSENMNDGDNPFGSDSTTNEGFGGPDKAPLEDAAETIAPSAASNGAEAPVAANTTGGGESVGATAPAAESWSTPTPAPVENLGESATANPAAPVAGSVSVAENPTNNANANAPKKKKKTGLIIGIIIAILLVGLVVGGVIFYMAHESKERTVLDAVTNLIGGNSQQLGSSVKTDARQFDGTIKMTDISENEGGAKDVNVAKNVTLSFKADTKASNFSGTGSLAIDFTNGKSISIDVSAAYMSNDGIYLQFNQLKDAKLEDILFGSMTGGTMCDDDSGSIGRNCIDDSDMSNLDGGLMSSMISSLIEAVDGKWFKIDSSTFADTENYQKSYSCMTEALDKVSSKEVKDKIAAIYKSHPFVENDDEKGISDADGLKYFSVKTSDDKYQAFLDEVKGLDAVKSLRTCVDGSSDSSYGDKEDEKEKITAEIKLGITGWSHELKVVKGNIKSESANMDIDVKIGYEEKDVVAPTDSAKTIEDLSKDFMSSFVKSTFMTNYVEQLAKQTCASYISSTSVYNQCVEKVKETYTAKMLEEIMGNIIPEVTRTSALLQ